MTSEIRANTLKNRVGLGTVSFTNTGAIVSGIVTANSFSGPISGTTGTFSGNVDINGDLDVDGHTNLDNVSIAGVTTFASTINASNINVSGNLSSVPAGDYSLMNWGALTLYAPTPALNFTETDANPDYRIILAGGVLKFQDVTNSFADRLTIGTTGNVSIANDLDVSGLINANDLIVTGTGVVGDFKSTNNNYVLGLSGNNTSVKAYLGSDSSGNFLLATGSGVDERLTITTNGYVGVKRSSPLANLHVSNNELAVGENPAGAAAPNTTYDGLVVDGSNASLINIRTRGNGSPSYGRVSFSDDVRSRGYVEYRHEDGSSDDQLRFATSSTVQLIIDSSGNIGINESAPSEKLQIDGDILLGGQANSSESNYAIKFEYNNHQFAKIVGDGRDSSGYGDLDFYTSPTNGASNLVQRMTIRADGKIGINETVPLARLHVKNGESNANGYAHDTIVVEDSDHAFLTFLTGTSGSSGINFGDAGDPQRGVIQYDQSNDYMRFITAAGERARITSTGKVLIGSSNHNGSIASGVGSQLQIEGNSYTTSSFTLINNQNSTDPAFINFGKSRAGSAGGTTIVQNGDRLGGIRWAGADGTDLHSRAASLDVYVDGAPGSNDMPGAMSFSTSPDGTHVPLNRLNIDSAGRITLGAGTQSQFASSFNSGANQLLITSNGSTGLTIDSTSSTSGSIHFADGPTGSESYRGIIEYQHSVDHMKIAVAGSHIARFRKGSYSDVGGGMIIGSSSSDAGVAHSDSRTLILGHTTHGETGISLVNSTSGTGRIRFTDSTSPFNQGTISYFHGTRTLAQISSFPESFSFGPAQKENQLVLNGNEAVRISSANNRHKMVDGFWEKSINTSFQTVFSIKSGHESSVHNAYFYEIIVFGGDWGSHSANRVYFKGFINGYNGYQGHTVIEHSGTYGNDYGGQGHYGSSQCQIEVTFTGTHDSHIRMRLTTGSVTAVGYARFIGFIRDYDGFNIR